MLKNTYLVTFMLVAFASQGFGQTGKKTPSSSVVSAKTPTVAKKSSSTKNTLETLPPVVIPAAPKEPILMTVGGDSVSKVEFESIYRKNNPKDSQNDRKALEEYLELFINFKLKVKAAKDVGKDTAKAFINELKGYRRQLAQPY